MEKRNWKTLDFYRKYQDIITPASIAFFQAEWDQSLKDFYHNTLRKLFNNNSYFLIRNFERFSYIREEITIYCVMNIDTSNPFQKFLFYW